MKCLPLIFFCLLAFSCQLSFLQPEDETSFGVEKGQAWVYLPLFPAPYRGSNLPELVFPDPGERGTPPLERIVKDTTQADYGFLYYLRTMEVDVVFDAEHPSVYVSYRQPYTELTDSQTIHAKWIDPDGNEFQNRSTQGGTQLLPIAKDTSYKLNGIPYPTYDGSEIYKTFASVPTNQTTTLSIVRSCTPIRDDEKNFVPEANFESPENGLNHEWADYRHLNMHTIVIHGADHRPAIEGMQSAFDQMSAIFAQKTAKLLLHHTSVVYEDKDLLNVLYESYDNNNPEVFGTFAHLFAQTAGVQKEDALNIFALREMIADPGTTGIAPHDGLSLFPQAGDRNVGVVVFLKAEGYTSKSGMDELGWRVAGATMAHEVGHGFGFEHTDYPDPLVDTPYRPTIT